MLVNQIQLGWKNTLDKFVLATANDSLTICNTLTTRLLKLVIASCISLSCLSALAQGSPGSHPPDPYPDNLTPNCASHQTPVYYFVFAWGANYGGPAYDIPENRGATYCSARAATYANFNNQNPGTSIVLDTCNDISQGGYWSATIYSNGVSSGSFDSNSSTSYAYPVCAVLKLRPVDVQCTPAQSGATTGQPIIPASGEKQLYETDYVDGAAHGLSLLRVYRSQVDDATATFGGNWMHSASAWISLGAGDGFRTARITLGNGNVRNFISNSNSYGSSWFSDDAPTELFVEVNNNNMIGFIYTDNAGTVYRFKGSSGSQPISVTQRNGWVMNYTYNAAGQLTQITNKFGRSLLLAYNASGLISQITQPDGKVLSYAYTAGVDNKPRLSKVTYPDNTFKSYLYENSSLTYALTGVMDENNVRLSTYSYDTQGLAIETTKQNNIDRYQVAYTGNGYSNSASVTDPLGTTRNYNYTINLNQLAVTSSDKAGSGGEGNASSRAQNALGLLESETDFRYINTIYTWDTARRLPTRVVRANTFDEAQTTSTQWHPAFRLPVLITESGATASATLRTTAYTYDSLGNKLTETITDTSVVPNIVRTTTWTYNAAGLVATEKAPNNALTSYTYNSAGLPITVRNALGHTTTLAYLGADGAAGRVTSMTAPNGAVTAYTYDARGRMLSSTQSAGTSTLATIYTYTPSGQLASAALPSGHTIAYTYDAAQRLVAWQDNRGARGNYTLDPMGNRTLEQIKNSAGQVVWQLARTMNDINRVATETIGASAGTINNNQSKTYGYDGNGDLISEANALGETINYGLDGMRRVTSVMNVIYAASTYANITYNALDAVTSASDFKAVTTATARDALGNALSTSSPDAGSQSAQYDALGLPKQIVDALGQATTITRDALGRPTLITQADGRSTTLRYDLTGTTYNATGFANASKGYLSEISDTTDVTKYQRDGFGRVVKKTQQLAPFTSGTAKSVSYSYVNSATNSGAGKGQLASITYPNNTVVSYVYSPAGQITQLNWGANPLITNIQYTPLGQPSSWNWEFADTSATTVLPATRAYDSAGRVIATELGTYTYDAAGRITALTQQLFKPANTTATSTAITATTAQFSIGYDALGRITSFSRAGSAGAASTAPLPTQTAVFSYDTNGNRLTSVQTTGQDATLKTTDRSYTVDAAGNRLQGFSQTLSNAGGAGVTSAVTYQHDANGALTSDGLRRYEFDAANRLAAVTTGLIDTSPTTRYVHNALGQRLFKTEPQFPPATGDENDPAFMASLIAFFSNLWGGNTGAANPSASEKLGFQYFYDEDGSLLYELGSGGASSTGAAHYVYLPTPSGPMPVAFYNGSKHYAIHTDHLNTPRRLTNSSKQVAWQWAFSAFGDEQPTTGKNRYVDPATTPNAGSTTIADVTFNLRYPGQYFDKESNLHYNYFRSYSPNNGRYTQSDPIDLDGGWNRFGYVDGDPLSMIDPEGLEGHHYVPQSHWRNEPLPPDTRRAFDRATTGSIPGGHNFGDGHNKYNQATKEMYENWKTQNKIKCETMTPKQAEDFVRLVKQSPDPRIRDFNNRIHQRIINGAMRSYRGPRGNE